MIEPMDRRRTVRRTHRLAISYSVLSDSCVTPFVYSKTHSTDISQGGLQLTVPEEIAPGSLIQICIHVPNTRTPVLMVGKARWRDCADSQARLGVQFIGNLPNQVEERINHGVELRDWLESDPMKSDVARSV